MTMSSSVVSTTFDLVVPEREQLADDRLGQRLEGARHDDLAVEHVGSTRTFVREQLVLHVLA